MRSIMKITIYPEKCCGSGQCVVNAPDLFDQKDNGIVILLNAEPSADQFESARLAAGICPALAIEIHEDQ